MSRRAIKCAYGGEIEFIPPRMRHSALYAPSRTNEDHATHDAFTPVAATGQERTTAAPGPSAYRRECDTPQFAPPSTPRFKIERTFRLLSISLLIWPGKTLITGHTFFSSGKVDSDDFSHKKWALACANAQNQTHYLSYKPNAAHLCTPPR